MRAICRIGLCGAVLTLVVAAIAPLSAVAGTTRVAVRLADDGTRSARVIVRAGHGEANKVAVRRQVLREGAVAWVVTDRWGRLSAGPGCARVAPVRARCPVPEAARVRRPFISLGDGNDYVYVDLARGAHILGGSGHDTIHARDGAVRLAPGPGIDKISFYPEKRGSHAVVHARDGQRDWITCGQGRQTLVVDRLDFADTSCERLRRSGPARAVFRKHELSTDDAQSWWDQAAFETGCPVDFNRPRCRVWFSLSQPGGRTYKTQHSTVPAGQARENAGGEVNGDLYSLRLSPCADDECGHVFVTLHSRDSRGRPYTLRQRIPVRVYPYYGDG